MSLLDRIMRGWVEHLDVDLDRAQAVLRLPPAARPLPPQGLPPVWGEDWDGGRVQLAAAVEPEPDGVEPEPVRAAPPRRMGAYARRSRA